MASRRAKVAGVALGLLAGLGGGLVGYRSYALRRQASAAAPAAPNPAPATAPTAAAPAHAEPEAAPAHAGHSAAAPQGTAAEREAVLLARLDGAARAPAPAAHGEAGDRAPAPPAAAHATAPAPMHDAAPPAPAPAAPAQVAAATPPPAHPAPAAPPAPAPGSAAAREVELLRRVAEGLLPAAAKPLVDLRPRGEPFSPASVARAESIAHERERAEEVRSREAAWPAILEGEPPPGPLPAVARPPPPKPRPPRLELPSRLDQWGE